MFHRYGKEGLSPRSKMDQALRPGAIFKNMTKIMPAAAMLAEEKRSIIVQKIKILSAFDEKKYEEFALSLMHNLVHHCQHLPESSTMYYSQQGGVLDYALNRTEAALTLFQQYLLKKDLDEPLSDEQQLWQYALFSAALLQGIGKLQVDFSVKLYDQQGQVLTSWNPLLESFVGKATHYSYELEKGDNEDFRRRLNLLLAKKLMPAKGFAWIASNKEVLAIWLALLNEDYYSAGTLGAILIRADAIAIQRYLEHLLEKALPPTHLNNNPYGRIGTFVGGQPEMSEELEQKIGLEFINWLKNALATKVLMINKAPLLMVPGGMLMNPDVFKLFIRQHPEFKNRQAAQVQNGFLSLKLHRFEHGAHRDMSTGIVFKDYAIALPEEFYEYDEKSDKANSVSAVELIAVTKNMALNNLGKWQQQDNKINEQASFKSRLPRSV